ncbi:hypothetical protein MRX96_015954 [Rhipicephalus microplus]
MPSRSFEQSRPASARLSGASRAWQMARVRITAATRCHSSRAEICACLHLTARHPSSYSDLTVSGSLLGRRRGSVTDPDGGA